MPADVLCRWMQAANLLLMKDDPAVVGLLEHGVAGDDSKGYLLLAPVGGTMLDGMSVTAIKKVIPQHSAP